MATRQDYNDARREIAKQARSEGFDQIADWLEGLANRPIPTPKGEEGELWHVGGDGSQVEDAEGQLVADCGNRDDAARIVATHNALAGIEDPEAAMKAVREALQKVRRMSIAKDKGFDIPTGEPARVKDAVNRALALLGAPK